METRIKRYSKKNRIKRRIKKEIKNLLKTIYKSLIYIIVGLAYTIYKIIYSFNNLIAKLFMKLPRIAKVITIYSIIAFAYFGLSTLITKDEIKVVSASTTITETIKEEIEEIEPIEEIIELPEVKTCPYDEISCKIFDAGIEKELSDDEILMAIAISKWETGNYTSYAFKSLNNVGGMMYWNGSKSVLQSFSSIDEGIEKYLNNLEKNYYNLGLDTLEEIQPKYCPIGADNDPNNLNQYWLDGVLNIYNKIKGK